MAELTHVPIDGVLDLHTFAPSEIKDVVLEYLDACDKRGIVDVRIIHGKGLGVQRERVHKILQRHPRVANFRVAGESEGGWGATLVRLHAHARERERERERQ